MSYQLLKPDVLTKDMIAIIGDFDGVHLGHQSVIGLARLDAPLGIVTFEPHPREFFSPGAAPFRLMNAEARANRLAKMGVERLFELPFDAKMAGLSPEAFSREVLAEGLGLSHVVVGADFCFGAGRKGKAFTIAVPSDGKYQAAIEGLIKQPIPPGEMPEVAFDDSPDRGEHRQPRSRHPQRRDKPRSDARPEPRSEARAEARPDETADITPKPPRREPAPARAEPRAETPRPEREPQPRVEPRRTETPRHDTPRHDHSRPEHRPYQGGRRDDGPRVVGMGDHMPDFLLRSFARSVTTTPDDDTSADEAAS
jgi:hypothetical protein